MWVRIPLLQLQDSEIGKRKAMWMLRKEVHHFLKNGGKIKAGIVCPQHRTEVNEVSSNAYRSDLNKRVPWWKSSGLVATR